MNSRFFCLDKKEDILNINILKKAYNVITFYKMKINNNIGFKINIILEDDQKKNNGKSKKEKEKLDNKSKDESKMEREEKMGNKLNVESKNIIEEKEAIKPDIEVEGKKSEESKEKINQK